jgi:hypothetical protein
MKIILMSEDPQQPHASFNAQPRKGSQLSNRSLSEELRLVAGIEQINNRSTKIWKIHPAAGEDVHVLLGKLLKKFDSLGYSVSELIDNTGQ